MAFASSLGEVIAYQKARALAREVFALSKTFPRDETYSLTDQIRRASRSVGAQIAEAWAKRRYEASFVAKLVDADAEAHETLHWLHVANECGYITPEQLAPLAEQCREVGRILSGMMSKSSDFSTPVHHAAQVRR
jgi:four helix bundle protein